MTSDGTPWRPLVHGLDIAKAIRMTCSRPARARCTARSSTSAATRNNYRVRDIAEIVAAEFPGCELTFGDPSADNRSYRVTFDKIREVLPGYDSRLGRRARRRAAARRLRVASTSTRTRSPAAGTPGSSRSST